MFSLLRGAPASVRDDERLSHTWVQRACPQATLATRRIGDICGHCGAARSRPAM